MCEFVNVESGDKLRHKTVYDERENRDKSYVFVHFK